MKNLQPLIIRWKQIWHSNFKVTLFIPSFYDNSSHRFGDFLYSPHLHREWWGMWSKIFHFHFFQKSWGESVLLIEWASKCPGVTHSLVVSIVSVYLSGSVHLWDRSRAGWEWGWVILGVWLYRGREISLSPKQSAFGGRFLPPFSFRFCLIYWKATWLSWLDVWTEVWNL